MRSPKRAEPEHSGNSDGDEVRIGQRRQLDSPDPISKSRQQVSCDFEAEPGLADVPGAGQRDEAVRGAETQDLDQLDIAADQLGSGRFVSGRDATGGGCGNPEAACASGLAETVRTSPVNW
jgi:hypothetical protein